MKKKRVLLTRSKEDNEYLKHILGQKKYLFMEISLLQYNDVFFDVDILNDFTDIIITSKRAATILPTIKEKKNVWVVGDKTAKILREKNYRVKYVANLANELKKVLPDVRYHSNIIYLSGNIITTEMPRDVKRVVIYKVKYKDNLLDSEIDLLKNNSLDYILLYSENCAKIFLKLLLENNLLKYVENSTIIAISYKVGKIMKNYFKKIVACSNPKQILEMLEDAKK